MSWVEVNYLGETLGCIQTHDLVGACVGAQENERYGTRTRYGVLLIYRNHAVWWTPPSQAQSTCKIIVEHLLTRLRAEGSPYR